MARMRPAGWAIKVPCVKHGAAKGVHCDGVADCLERKIAALEKEKARAKRKREAMIRRFLAD